MRPPIEAHATVERLRVEVRRIEGLHHRASDAAITTGCPALDRLLPSQGLRPGTLVEWLADGAGSGAATLALLAAREACQRGGMLAVLDHRRWFYPLAAAGLGIDLERLLVVRPPNRSDDTWALDQLLRSRAVAAALAWPDDWDQQTFRRLQLAAEAGVGLGLLVRPRSVRSEPSWAEVRLLAEPRSHGLKNAADVDAPAPYAATLPARAGRRWRLEVLRVRGGPAGGAVEVELDERTGRLHEAPAADSVRLVSAVAAGAPRRRSRRA